VVYTRHFSERLYINVYHYI